MRAFARRTAWTSATGHTGLMSWFSRRKRRADDDAPNCSAFLELYLHVLRRAGYQLTMYPHVATR